MQKPSSLSQKPKNEVQRFKKQYAVFLICHHNPQQITNCFQKLVFQTNEEYLPYSFSALNLSNTMKLIHPRKIENIPCSTIFPN